MIIDSIQNGIVIDHICAGNAMELYNILGLGNLDCTVAILKNVTSKKLGRKDIIKIDQVMELPEGARIMIMAPVIRQKKGSHKDLFDKMRKDGYVRAEVDGEMREVYGDATPIIVVYDKDRKMIYSEAYTGAGVHMGENSFELSIDTSSFAGQLEGGYLGFYLWDSFGSLQPIMDAIEIR